MRTANGPEVGTDHGTPTATEAAPTDAPRPLTGAWTANCPSLQPDGPTIGFRAPGRLGAPPPLRTDWRGAWRRQSGVRSGPNMGAWTFELSIARGTGEHGGLPKTSGARAAPTAEPRGPQESEFP